MKTKPLDRFSVVKFIMLAMIKLKIAAFRFKTILCYEDYSILRIMIALASLTWGVTLLNPNPTFIDNEHIYSVMQQIASKGMWAILFFVSGIIGLTTVLGGVKNRYFLVYDSLLASLMWTTSALACFASHWPLQGGFWHQLSMYDPPAAFAGNLWFSVTTWWVFIRTVTDPLFPSEPIK